MSAPLTDHPNSSEYQRAIEDAACDLAAPQPKADAGDREMAERSLAALRDRVRNHRTTNADYMPLLDALGKALDDAAAAHRYALNLVTNMVAAPQSPAKGRAEPVGFRVHDFADGWIYFEDQSSACAEADHGDRKIEPLYPASALSDREAEIVDLTRWRDHWRANAQEQLLERQRVEAERDAAAARAEELEKGLRRVTERALKWFDNSGASISARWHRIPAEERVALINDLRAARSLLNRQEAAIRALSAPSPVPVEGERRDDSTPPGDVRPFAMGIDAKAEIMRLMREEFDPTPPSWEGRDWDDNAEDVASKIIAIALSEEPAHISDAWKIVKQWLCDYAAEELAFSRYKSNVMLDGVMTAGEMRRLSTAIAFRCCRGLAPIAECGCEQPLYDSTALSSAASAERERIRKVVKEKIAALDTHDVVALHIYEALRDLLQSMEPSHG